MRKNSALLVDRNTFNQFTLGLFGECTNFGGIPDSKLVPESKFVNVILRNGTQERVRWLGRDLNAPDNAVFGDSVSARVWRADGSSLSNNPDFDIIEF